MDLQEQQKYKGMIERKVDELRRHLAQPDKSTDPVSLDNPIGRLTRIDAMQAQQMAIELRRRQEGQLARLEKALRLIEEGKYGACGRCGEDIAQKRLEVYPDARLCIDCAEKLERRS